MSALFSFPDDGGTEKALGPIRVSCNTLNTISPTARENLAWNGEAFDAVEEMLIDASVNLFNEVARSWRTSGSAKLNMYLRGRLLKFRNATWKVFRMKARSTEMGQLGGRPA